MKEKKATKVTGCNTCKKGLSSTQYAMLILGSYVLLSSVYGTIQIIKLLSGLF